MTKSKKSIWLLITVAVIAFSLIMLLWLSDHFFNAQALDSPTIDINIEVPLDEDEQFLGLRENAAVSTNQDMTNAIDLPLASSQPQNGFTGTIPMGEFATNSETLSTLYVEVPHYYIGKTLEEPISIPDIDEELVYTVDVDGDEAAAADINTNGSPFVINYEGKPWLELESTAYGIENW